MPTRRQSGILLHPTSLPGPYGIGEIGRAAADWLLALHEAGQQVWQILPCQPTGYGDSPYQPLSTFAGNPAWIAFDELIRDGLVDPRDLYGFPVLHPLRVDFRRALPARAAILRLACDRFSGRRGARFRAAAERFFRAEAGWLDDYALFAALKRRLGGRAWTDWPEPLRRREAAAIREAKRSLGREIRRERVAQYLFDRQWRALRRRARRLGVSMFGDLPLFVAHDSADVWARPGLFRLDAAGRPEVVAGVPPDYFSSTGQRWGNPLYRWEAHEADGFDWWASRLRRTLAWVDLVRLDHFRGLEQHWEIPAGEPTAIRGRWVPGPGARLLSALRDRLGGLPLVAEDLGYITPEVHALRKAFRLPGMSVLQFLFGDDRDAEAAARLPADTVVYTGTHDNDTTAGWWGGPDAADPGRSPEQAAAERKRVLRALGGDGREMPWDLIRFAWRSRARIAIAPLQDVLGLDSRSRMNTPGTPSGNWAWRFVRDQFSPPLRERLRELTASSRRGPE